MNIFQVPPAIIKTNLVENAINEIDEASSVLTEWKLIV